MMEFNGNKREALGNNEKGPFEGPLKELVHIYDLLAVSSNEEAKNRLRKALENARPRFETVSSLHEFNTILDGWKTEENNDLICLGRRVLDVAKQRFERASSERN